MANVELTEEQKAQNRRELRRIMKTPIDEPEGSLRADLVNQRQDWLNQESYKKATKRAKGGSVKSSASRRADGVAQRGKTKGRMI